MLAHSGTQLRQSVHSACTGCRVYRCTCGIIPPPPPLFCQEQGPRFTSKCIPAPQACLHAVWHTHIHSFASAVSCTYRTRHTQFGTNIGFSALLQWLVGRADDCAHFVLDLDLPVNLNSIWQLVVGQRHAAMQLAGVAAAGAMVGMLATLLCRRLLRL